MKNVKMILCAGLLALSQGLFAYDKVGNGIVIRLEQKDSSKPKAVKLQVVGDKIIRVEATPDAVFPKSTSLIIVPQKAKPKYTVAENDKEVTLTTQSIKAVVCKKTGEVKFTDLTGNVILKEDSEKGKTFTPYNVGETKGYSYRTVFESSDDEAFYGLGQHQANDMNYKGKSEELYQYNTKVSIPFIISTHNYGILWDSYSLCRWGNPNDYLQLQKAFKLYDKDGKAGGLTGTYIPLAITGAKKVVRTEDSLYFDHIYTRKNFPEAFPLNGSHVQYEGYIQPDRDALYRFLLYYAGYMKVYIDGKEVVSERWRTAWNPNSYKFNVDLKKGQKHHLLIDWYPDGGDSYCSLRAIAPESEEEQKKLSFWSEMTPSLDYYFIAGKNMDEVISGYRTLTGKAQVMPKWVLGFWQSREKYNTQDEIVSTLKHFRDNNLPIDNIVQDWLYWKEDQWGSCEFDPKRFPEPQKMIDSIHGMHAHYMISHWPKYYVNTEHFKEFEKNGWMYMQAVKDNIKDWVGPGYVGSFYDAYSAGARKLFWNQMNEHLFKYGVDAWWMDASEPNIRDCTPMPYRKALCGPTALGPSDQYFNAYSLPNAMAIYDGQRSVKPNQRVFLLTRSGFAGEQRYSTATWSGDIGTRWEDMAAQITAGVNFSMSGVPFWSMDIGGFSVEKRYEEAQKFFEKTGLENNDLNEWRELNARWHQFGAFVPMYRTHGQFPFREIWNLSPEGTSCYNVIKEYTKLRYNLMPYLYSMAGWVHFKDYTIMRGLAMDFQDKNVYDIADQYMFGPSFMVCPVLEYKARSREVYFPSGTGWYNFYTGKYVYGGGKQTVDAPYEQIPLFVPEGAIIPFGPDLQYSDEKKPENITLYVYAGKDGSFQLYEDENVNYNYEKGKYSTIDFIYNNEKKSLTIADRKGSFDGMLQSRTFNIILVDKDNAKPFNLNEKGIEVKYSGKKVVIRL